VKVSVVADSSTEVLPADSAMVNAAMSSSVVVTETVWSAMRSKASLEFPSSTATVMVVFWEPSTVTSSSPVTVTV